MDTKFLEAIATLVGVIIGAGVLAIPYVVAKAGLLTGIVDIIIIGIALIIVNLYLGEVVLRTKGNHQLTGYAYRYLGKNGRRAMALIMTVLIYGAMIAYTIGVGESIAGIFPQINALWGSMAFYAIAAAILYIGIKAVKESELLLSFIVLLIIGVIVSLAVSSEHFTTASFGLFDISKMLVPYGVVLFALLGEVAVPEMKEELGKQRKKLKAAIIIGGIIPIIAYSLFAAAVVGITDAETSQIATIKLGEAMGQKMVVFANLFAIFAMTTSFLALGLALKEMYNFDYRLNSRLSWALAVAVPITAFLLGVKGFIAVIGTVGVLAGGAAGIMIILMHMKARKLGQLKPEYEIKNNGILNVLLIAMFAAGVINLIAFN